MVVVVGAWPMISTLPGLGSKRLPGLDPSLGVFDSPCALTQNPKGSQYRGIRKSVCVGEVDRAREPRQRLGGGVHSPLSPLGG